VTTGMLQLLVVGFEGNKFSGQIVPELDALRASGTIRLIDLAFVIKDDAGEVTSVQFSDLSEEEKLEFGMTAGALIGFGAAGEAGAEIGAEVGAENVLEGDFGVADEDVDEIAADLDANSSALVMLVEHLWSIPFKQAVINSDGRLVGNWIIHPEMLVEMGAEMAAEREEQILESGA
jgi:uncharacterized membrane protein